ncbi:HORMA domain-containing protein 1 [Amia ocellicauda]|uniref:HORMA domain-containing protein 1 n=1 Tax=Amia ocellicauda TaxID=2972642 RepID=UPI003463BC84
MATAQRQKNLTNTQIFPTVVSTEQQSLVLVKKLLAIAVSCITYLRGVFSERAYGTKYVEGQCIKILKEDRSCPGSTQIVKWMQGCYDALQRKYLRMVVLSIYTDQDNPQTVTECYQFKIKYTREGPLLDIESGDKKTISQVSCGDTKKASILLVRKLYVLMQNLGPLPSDVYLNMKLFYYDEVTPQDYQPPGFKEGDSESMMFEGEPVHLAVGEVATPFHTLKVKVTTERERMEQVLPADGEEECGQGADFTVLPLLLLSFPAPSTPPTLSSWPCPSASPPLPCSSHSSPCVSCAQVDQGELICEKGKQAEVLGPGEETDTQESSMNIIQERLPAERDTGTGTEHDEVRLTCQEDLGTSGERPDASQVSVSLSPFPPAEILPTMLSGGKSCSHGVSLFQMDRLVSKAFDVQLAVSRTRSGRAVQRPQSVEEKGKADVGVVGKRRKKTVSEFEIPRSQDETPAPKRRKFSEPKECF